MHEILLISTCVQVLRDAGAERTEERNDKRGHARIHVRFTRNSLQATDKYS